MWQNFHSYRVFEEFLQRIVIDRKSYITIAGEEIDFQKGFNEIKLLFVDGFDLSDSSFDDKATRQFRDASLNTKRLFANLEYLWSMPVTNISGDTKREYGQRWFRDDEMVAGERYFFSGNHGIANPGMWHLTNKYHEILSICRIFQDVTADQTVKSVMDAKNRIESLTHEAIYGKIDRNADFFTKNKCSSYHMLLHLAHPDRYEAIVSENHKTRIASVFAHVIDGENPGGREREIARIREKLYHTYGVTDDIKRKRRWFFYLDDVKPLWIDKKSKSEQRMASVSAEVLEEVTAELEGEREEYTGYRLRRSGKLVLAAKQRDGFTCLACGFHYKGKIVQAHHLDPLSERKHPEKTKREDLVTLCPNCHYLAHYLLRESDRYKRKDVLIAAIRKANSKRM